MIGLRKRKRKLRYKNMEEPSVHQSAEFPGYTQLDLRGTRTSSEPNQLNENWARTGSDESEPNQNWVKME